MSYRFMRIIVFFDLPVETVDQRREYVRFRKSLLKDGFMMMQESVYCKLVLNQVSAYSVISRVKKYSANYGIIQLLVLTEKQYSNIEMIIGEKISEVIESEDRLVIL